MTTLLPVFIALFVGLLQARPVILSADDIGDYSDDAPAALVGEKSWLGLFIVGSQAQEGQRESRLGAVRVTFVARRDAGRTTFQMVTTPAGASLLIAGLPRVSAGPAVTAGRFITLGSDQREAAFKLGERSYGVRLASKQADLCDGTITLSSEGRTQTLFDAREPDTTREPALSCDEPHFTIHWAGDLDRDGRLDMLVTFSRKYSYMPRQLLLSSAARSQDLVGEAGRYERYSR